MILNMLDRNFAKKTFSKGLKGLLENFEASQRNVKGKV